MKQKPKKIKRWVDYSTIPPKRMVTCIDCGKDKQYHAKNMCTVCYADIRNKKRAEINTYIF